MKKSLVFILVTALMVSLFIGIPVSAADTTIEELTAENTASTKTLENGVTYYLTQDLTINASKTNKNGLVVAAGANVVISIPEGVTLTVYGKNGSGITGGGAAIQLPDGATLHVYGSGTLVAVGGNAGNGSKGGSGSRSIANDNVNGHYKSEFGSNTVYFAGAGGTGGNGGGGAGAGIGTDGGTGGYGRGSGGSGWNDNGIVDSNRNGNSGSYGAAGSSGSASGIFLRDATIDVSGVRGGSQGTAGSGGSRGSNGYDGDNGDARGIAGGAGGGGGAGGLAGAAVGTGGGGGGQGGGGGSAGYIWGGRYVGGGGGGGGQGAGTSYGGAYGSDGEIDEYDCDNDRVSSVTVHTWSGNGASGNINSYGSGGNGAYMTIKSRGGEYYSGAAGSGARGGYSGNAATAYTPDDESGKYIVVYESSSGGGSGSGSGSGSGVATLSVTYTDNVADETIFEDVVHSFSLGGTAPAFGTSPTRAGYLFKGWYTDPSCTEDTAWNLAGTVVTESITLYAKWIEFNWTTDTDSGCFENGGEMEAVIRFLFDVTMSDEMKANIEETGIKYINSEDILSDVESITFAGASGTGTVTTFYGDIIEISKDKEGSTYYAIAYAIVDGKTYWSAPVGCVPAFDDVIIYD